MTKKPETGEALLTQAQSAALPLLATGAKKKDAAAVAGVCAQTVSEWLRDAHFSAALRARREEFVALAGARLGKVVEVAADTVLELLKSGSEPTRLKAAIFVLDRMLLVQPGGSAPSLVNESSDEQALLSALGVNVS